MKVKKLILPIVMLLLLIVATIGVTFAAFTFTKQGTVENIIESSTIMLTYTEGKTGIMLNEAYPMSDDRGKLLTGENNVFDFTVTATLGKSNVISYEVSAVKIPITDMTPLEDNEVKLYLERAIDPDSTYQEVLSPSNFIPIENQSEVGTPDGAMILDKGMFMNEGTTIHNYRLRLWVDEKANIPNGEARKYGVKINVYAKQLQYEKIDESCFTFDSTTGTITDYSDTCPKDVMIPNMISGVEVVSIGRQAFYKNDLNSVIIPNTVTTIGVNAFAINQLKTIVIPSNVTSIGDMSFYNNQLVNITMMNSSLSIGGGAFNDNQLPDNKAFIYARTEEKEIDYTTVVSYGGAKRDSVMIPNQVTTIGSYAFSSNQLTSVTISDSVVSIGESAFAGNPLTSVEIPNSLTTIGNTAFVNNQLTSVTLGNNVTLIGNGAFQNNQLASVTIPDSVTTIGYYAFDSNQLTSVTIGNNVNSIGNSAFNNNQLTEVIIPEKVEYIGGYAFHKDLSSNPNLIKIINKTGKYFNWGDVTNGSGSFVSGTISHNHGNITVTSE